MNNNTIEALQEFIISIQILVQHASARGSITDYTANTVLYQSDKLKIALNEELLPSLKPLLKDIQTSE